MEIENEVTISTHNGSQVARQHNLRNPRDIAVTGIPCCSHTSINAFPRRINFNCKVC